MTALDFYLAHPSSGSADDLTAADQPLGAGRVQAHLAGNAALLAARNWKRVLVSDPGLVEFWKPLASPTNEIRWEGRPGDGFLALDLGSHYVHRHPKSGKWPRLHFTGTVWVASSYVATVYFAVAPGVRGPRSIAFSVGGDYSVQTDLSFVVDLTDAMVERRPIAPSGAAGSLPPGEGGELALVTLLCGGACDSNSKSFPGTVQGLVVYIEEQS